MSAPNTNPTARPPKPPALTSIPSTPGPDVPGGYPRNSVVFATNKWDRPSSKGKSGPGLLAATKAYLPPAVASYFPSSSASTSASVLDLDSPGRPSSAGNTPGVALHSDSSATSALSTRAWAGSDSSRGTLTPTPGDFPTPGGRTFASHNSNPNSNSKSSDAVERDYFGPVVVADGDEQSHSTDAASPDRDSSAPAVAPNPVSTTVVDSGVVPPPTESNTPPMSTVDSPTLPTEKSTTPASPISSASNSSGAGSGFSTTPESTTSTAPSSTLSVPVSSPKSLKPRPSVTYSPSTADARPTVTKAGSRLAPRSPVSASGDASGSTSGSGSRLSGAVKRFASLRRRDNHHPAPSAFGEDSRGASLDSSPPAATTTSSGSPTATSKSTEVSASKPSRRASLMRTLRGVAGRVRGDRGRNIVAGAGEV